MTLLNLNNFNVVTCNVCYCPPPPSALLAAGCNVCNVCNVWHLSAEVAVRFHIHVVFNTS